MHLHSLRIHRIEDLEEMINLRREHLALTSPGHSNHPEVLLILLLSLETQYKCTDDMDYVKEAIEHLYEALKLAKSGPHLSRSILQLLARALLDRFMRCGTDEDMASAIKHYQTSISLIPEGHPEVTSNLSDFAGCLSIIFSRTGYADYLEESITLYQSAVKYPFSSVCERMEAAYSWAFTAHSTRHPQPWLHTARFSPYFSM